MKTVRVGTFRGRPPSVCSGVTFEPRIPVSLQHRSDILIEKQKENLEHVQHELESSLIERKRIRSKTEAELLRKKILHLRKSCDQMQIILQLVLKLNAELSYARLDLVKAFQDRKNVNMVRKRVVWLEDRIKKILESHWLEEAFLGDHASIESGDSVEVSKSSGPFPSSSSSFRYSRKSEGSASNGKCSPGSCGSKGLLDIKPSDIHYNSPTENTKLIDVTVLPRSMSSCDKTNKDDSVSQPYLNSDGMLDENNSLSLQPDTEEGIAVTSEEPKTFITEVAPSSQQHQNYINQLTPTKGENLIEPNPLPDYWKSEHHRFESSILEDVDATSYHQMTLAVPGTFVTDVCTSPELPWRQETMASTGKTSEVTELDALSKSVSSMFSAVKTGALVSVDAGMNGTAAASKRTNLLDEIKRINSPSTFAKMPLSIYSKWLPETSKGFPSISKRSRKIERLNVKSLPIARVDRSKVFPRSSDRFSNSIPGLDSPAVRIVDQRNLQEETKFSSTLFRSKRGRHIRPVSVESRFRQLIAEDSKPKSSAVWNSSGCLSRGLSKEIRMTDQQREDLRVAQTTRIEEIINVNLKSGVDCERADAARSLGLLGHSESQVIEALREAVKTDSVERVIYEATRSLVLLGCWDQNVQEQLSVYLCIGNREIKADLLQSMITGCKQSSSLDKEQDIFSELIEILCELCQNDDPLDLVSFRAAICLACLNIVKEEAARKLRTVIDLSNDPHTKAQALSALILLSSELDEENVDLILHQLNLSSVWKYRKDAARHLTEIGLKYKLSSVIKDKIYACLKTALWNDVNSMVRTEVGKALTACGLMQKTCEEVRQHLEDASDAVRTQAVISVGTLGLKSERMLKVLLNLVQLDPSHKVQQMVIRTFVVLQYQDERVLTILKHKATIEGIVAREAQKALEILSKLKTNREKSFTNSR